MNTPRDLAAPLPRVTWRDGQTLASRDLRDDGRMNDRLRHLHVRYVHRTWGIVEGLQVTAQGNAAVIVGPGYALDIEGAELLAPQPVRLLVPANPPGAITMYLVLTRQPAISACRPSFDLSTLCLGNRNPIALERGLLAWKTVDQVCLGPDVLLARAVIKNGKIAGALDSSVARHASTMARSRIWADTTVQGSTGWQDAGDTLPKSIEAIVDISDAGFTSPPACFAGLSFPAGTSPGVAGYIRESGPTSFTFALRPLSPASLNLTLNAHSVEQFGVTIAWIAVEIDAAVGALKGKSL